MKNVLLLVFSLSILVLTQGNAQRSVEILPDVDTLYVCTDSTLQLYATDALTYSWSPAEIFDDPSIQNPQVTPDGPVLVQLEAIVNGIPRRDSVVIIPTLPNISLSTDATDELCVGEIATIRVNSNAGLLGLSWEPTDMGLVDSFSNRIEVQPPATTEYFATLNLTGCVARDSITIDVNPLRLSILNPDPVLLCQGSEAILSASTTASDPESLVWRAARGLLLDTTGTSIRVRPRRNTTFYVHLEEGDCNLVDSIFVQVDSLDFDLDIELTEEEKDPYCQGDTVKLVSPTFNPEEYPNVSHIWSSTLIYPDQGEDPVGTVGFETPDSLFNLVVTAQDSATYKRITRNGGCIDSAQVLVPVIQPKEITIEPEPAIVCPGESIQLTASFDGPGEITWMPEEIIQGLGDQKTVTVGPISENTEVTIQVEEEGCPSSQSTTVQILPNLFVFNTQTVICEGDQIQLNLSSIPGAEYRWSSPDDPGLNSTDPNLIVSPTQTTRYDLEASFGECPAQEGGITIQVIDQASVSISPGDQVICPDEEVTLTAEGNAPSFAQERFTWSFGGSSQNGPELRITNLMDDGTFVMNYEVLTPNGRSCFSATDEVTLTVEELPEIVGFGFNPTSATDEGIALGDNVGVLADIAGSTDGYSFAWMANEENISGSGPEITHAPSEDPTVYKLTLTSPNDCIVEGLSPEVKVIVPAYSIPNVFTPNDDNVNDFFNIAYVGISDLSSFIQEFKVFNRWGQLVYDNETPETGWDGNVNGNPAPSDVYVYKIVVQFPDGRREDNSGEVTLIR